MHPQARPHNWLIHRIIERELRDRLQRHARGRLLDIGCGVKPYAALTAGLVDEHVGLEHDRSPHGGRDADLIGSAYSIPSGDARFDTILCTDVLEHLERPVEAARESLRVLRPGGCAIVTVPLFWHLHEEPRDFFRYTRHGLRHVLEDAGFEVLSVTALSGFCVTFAQELCYFLQRFAGRTAVDPRRWIVRGFCHAVQAFAWLAHHVERNESFTVEYIAVARKPLAPAHADANQLMFDWRPTRRLAA